MIGYGYNPNLSNIANREISLIYSNIPHSYSGSIADGEIGEKSKS